MTKKRFFITTAIAYLNGPPHLGHALEIIQADCLARFYRQLGKDVIFQTGSDEHGMKILNTAQEKKMEVTALIEKNYQEFVRLYKELNISYDRFIRTTSSKHKRGASKFWLKMVESDDIYKSTYDGLYCVGCEAYKTSRDLVDGKCPFHPNRNLIILREENYFFRLTKYVDELKKIYETDRIKIIPRSRKAEIVSILNGDIDDVSFSRQKIKMPWGIPVPNDDKHVMYVWADALSNYITNIGYGFDENEFNSIWPADIHLIGKDIIKFHAIYWPAMLLSAGLQLPKSILSHGFINFEGLKIGKSLGNAMDPFLFIKKYGAVAFRFYLLKYIPSSGDGSFSEEELIKDYNTSLADVLGNLLLRVFTFIEQYFNKKIPKPHKLHDIDEEFIQKFNFVNELKNYFTNFQLNLALSRVWQFIRETNKYINDCEPWEIRKKGNMERLSTVIYILIEAIRIISIYIYPFIPRISEKIFNIIGLESDHNLGNVDYRSNTVGKIGEREILFPKVKLKREEDPLELFDFKVGKIIEVKNHPKLEEFYVIKVDIKEKILTACVKIALDYKKNELKEQRFVFLTNIKPRKIGGILSDCMLLGGRGADDKLELVRIKGEPGEQVFIGDIEPNPRTISSKNLKKIEILSKQNKVMIKGKFLKTNRNHAEINLEDGIKLN
ncbi:MAG: methionine--tRNA ligase [Candidatus Helarchaeota archaeon]